METNRRTFFVWAVAFVVFGSVGVVFADGPGGVSPAVPRRGHCPRTLKVVPSQTGCKCDEDCPAGDKCCVFDRGAVCVAPAYTKSGVCPRRRWGNGACAEFCSDDSDCPSDEKCCHNGCGHQCTAPYRVKPGRCAPPRGAPLCAEYCHHDGECPGSLKCCRTSCGHACSEPC